MSSNAFYCEKTINSMTDSNDQLTYQKAQAEKVTPIKETMEKRISPAPTEDPNKSGKNFFNDRSRRNQSLAPMSSTQYKFFDVNISDGNSSQES